MATDLRGFRDSLAPVRRHRQSLLDQAAAAAADLQSRLRRAESAHVEAAQRLKDASEQATKTWRHRTDPSSYTGLLTYLAQQQFVVLAAAREEERLREELTQARRRMLARRQDVDTLERYRDGALADYRLAWGRKTAAEADADWIARAALRRGAHR